jgi:hypothetical protein
MEYRTILLAIILAAGIVDGWILAIGYRPPAGGAAGVIVFPPTISSLK